MARWLIAVFTFHFLLSVGVSALGKMPSVEPPLQRGVPAIHAALLYENLESSQAGQPHTAEQEHAAGACESSFADANQDLPDDQNIRLVLSGPGHAPAHCPAVAAAAPPSAVLKKQPKRPRAGHALRA